MFFKGGIVCSKFLERTNHPMEKKAPPSHGACWRGNRSCAEESSQQSEQDTILDGTRTQRGKLLRTYPINKS